VLFDRAYGDFAQDAMPPLHDRLVTFSTFSKAWGLAGLRVGWLASTASTCREIRKVKLPYSLNIVSEAVAATALEHPEIRSRNVANTISERARVFEAMEKIEGVTPFPSRSNFIAFTTQRNAKDVFNDLHARGILIRDIGAAVPNALRVSIGTPEQNNAFLEALTSCV
jgi:histidinol-phosphate aminotransferase